MVVMARVRQLVQSLEHLPDAHAILAADPKTTPNTGWTRFADSGSGAYYVNHGDYGVSLQI